MPRLVTRAVLVVLLVAAVVVPVVVAGPSSAAAPTGPWAWPLDRHTVGKRFDPPADRYGAGHRGVDLTGLVGDPVRSVAAGRVTFAGPVGGVPVVTVDHGRERSTYQPVAAVVRVGDAVAARQVIGTLLGGHGHCEAGGACLHLGRLAGDAYLDPLELLGSARFRLISPDGDPPSPPVGADPGGLLGPDGLSGSGVPGTLRRPVGGPVTSPFGMRVHPVTGVRALHDGTDFGVPCGTPVRAAADGVVVSSGPAGAYGQQVAVRHGPGAVTSYSHLSRRQAATGKRVTAGDVVGHVGSTGTSTGCHLHFMVTRVGHPTDPMASL